MEHIKQYAQVLFGLSLTDEQIGLFQRYVDELIAWNSHTNLTAIIEPQAILIRHFLDSLSLASFLPSDVPCHVIDVGTGAGFPGMVLAILSPNLKVTLLEATGKKIKFLAHVIDQLGLQNAYTLNARAEEAGHISHHRARYDVVLARAVARLPALLEYMLPLAKIGGMCIAMKGASASDELDDSQTALATLGGKFQRMATIRLPTVDEAHHLIFVEKIAKTPPDYPRKPGIPTRKPLGG